MSRFNHQRKSCKGAECFRQVFEGTSLDMKGFGLGCVYFMCGLSEMEFLGCVVFSSNVLNLGILYRLS